MNRTSPANVEELERRIRELPRGYLSIKIIKGKERYYHQWYEAGKLQTKYVRADDYPELKEKIDLRRKLENELANARLASVPEPFRTDVITDGGLYKLAANADGMDKRECYSRLDSYLHRDDASVCIIYGLRRTGKSILMFQALGDMDDEAISRTAYITVGAENTMSDLRSDMARLRSAGIEIFFIDEVTRLKDFIHTSYFFPDVVAATGCRVVLTGTDSLGFWLASKNELYCRAVTIHTTHIPFREHHRLLGADLDDYMRYGGIFRGGQLYIEDPQTFEDRMAFDKRQTVDEYVGIAIAGNIESTLTHFDKSTRFKRLYEMHMEGEFRDVVNRLVEDLNHRFLISVLRSEFSSSLLVNVDRNMTQTRDREYLDAALDMERVNSSISEILGIISDNARKVELEEEDVGSLKRYLTAMDVFRDALVVTDDPDRDFSEATICVQPGLRYFHAQALLMALKADPRFLDMSDDLRQRIAETVHRTISGHILEEIVTMDTADVLGSRYEVCKLVLKDAEVDMVIHDVENGGCVLAEVKLSESRHRSQTRHLTDGSVLDYARRRFGPVRGRYVLYRGEDVPETGGVSYINVERYLLELPGSVERMLWR